MKTYNWLFNISYYFFGVKIVADTYLDTDKKRNIFTEALGVNFFLC